MKILLDTHCWLWWFLEPDKLGARAIELISDRRNQIFFSAASAWEIAIKSSIKKLKLPDQPKPYIPTRLAEQGMTSLPITVEHALLVDELPFHHKDPFDRILVAQAQVENLSLMSADLKVSKYSVDIISPSK